MDYRKLCVELFGTDDEATLRKIAAEYRKKNTRNAGRKRKISDDDIRKMRAMRNAGHPCRNWQGHLGSLVKRLSDT